MKENYRNNALNMCFNFYCVYSLTISYMNSMHSVQFCVRMPFQSHITLYGHFFVGFCGKLKEKEQPIFSTTFIRNGATCFLLTDDLFCKAAPSDISSSSFPYSLVSEHPRIQQLLESWAFVEVGFCSFEMPSGTHTHSQYVDDHIWYFMTKQWLPELYIPTDSP